MKYTEEYWRDIEKVADSIPGIEELIGKKIVITGSTGMLCSPVIEIISYLNAKKGYGIKLYLAGRRRERIIERFKQVFSPEEFEFIYYDATRRNRIDIAVDYIIHAANNADPLTYSAYPVDTLLGSIVGAEVMLELSRNNKNSRMLYVSSSEVYGKTESREAFSEEDYGFVDILKARSCYPSGKRAAETLCVSYKDQYAVDVVIVRPGHIYGPSITDSDNRASASFTRNAFHGENIVMKSAGTQLRSYCYTLDCASALLTVLLNGKSGDAYNISNKNSVVTIRAIAEEIAKVAGVEVVFEKPSEKEKKGYNMMDNSSLDASKLENLGWKALFSLEEGCQRTILYYG